MIVSTWTKREVRALRKSALRLTQEKFAERVGYSAAAVGKWEQATKERPVRGSSAQDLDTVLANLDAAQLARFEEALSGDDETAKSSLAPPGDAIARFRDTQESDVKRRDFGRVAVATAVAAALPTNHMRIGHDDVQRLLSEVMDLDEQDQRAGGTSLVGRAVRELEQARELLDTCAFDARTGNAFTAATGELAVLAGWLAYDSDLHVLARRCYADALALGAEADDNILQAHTCLYAANQASSLARPNQVTASDRTGSPYKALQLTDRARDLVRGLPAGRIHALVGLREAQAYALLGDRSAFGRAIAMAWRELDHAMQFEPLDEVPQWLRFVTPSEVADTEARGYADMGDLRRSIDLYSTAVEHPASARNSTIVRAWSAATRARAGDVTGALEHGLPALQSLSSVSSTRILRRLEPVRTAVAVSRAGTEFCDMYDILSRKALTT